MGALVFVRFLPQVGNEAKVEAILRGMVAPTRAEPGNLRYDLLKTTNAEGRVIYHLLEQYADDAAVAFHRETPHYAAYRPAVMPLLEDPISISFLEPLDARL